MIILEYLIQIIGLSFICIVPFFVPYILHLSTCFVGETESSFKKFKRNFEEIQWIKVHGWNYLVGDDENLIQAVIPSLINDYNHVSNTICVKGINYCFINPINHYRYLLFIRFVKTTNKYKYLDEKQVIRRDRLEKLNKLNEINELK